MVVTNIEVNMITNPSVATITVSPPDNVAQFHLRYRKDGNIVADLIVAANYVTNADFVQSLSGLNALVGAADQNADLVFQAAAKNAGGESVFFTDDELVQIVNAPAAPSAVELS